MGSLQNLWNVENKNSSKKQKPFRILGWWVRDNRLKYTKINKKWYQDKGKIADKALYTVIKEFSDAII